MNILSVLIIHINTRIQRPYPQNGLVIFLCLLLKKLPFFSKYRNSRLVNHFPNKSWFLCVCSINLLKTRGKGEIARHEQFLLSHYDFFLFGELSVIFINSETFEFYFYNTDINEFSSTWKWICCCNDVMNHVDCVIKLDVYPQKMHSCSKNIRGTSFLF